MDSETTALVLKDNIQLSKIGGDFTKTFLTDWCRASFPSLPNEGVDSIVGHLTSSTVIVHVGKNLGVEDLTMSGECPVPDNVLHSTFMAVIGALRESSGAERTGFFIRVSGPREIIVNNFIHTYAFLLLKLQKCDNFLYLLPPL